MSGGNLMVYMWLGQGTIALFIFALGACTGSFLNVVAYRLPRGKSIVSPPSACPGCKTRLGLRENLPIFGWLMLRGKCRHCGIKISPQYLLMELVVAVLFVVLWFLWGVDARALSTVGIELGAWRPEWALTSMKLVWPIFMLGIILVGALVVSTLIDAQTFTIPAVIPWIVMAVALVVHPMTAYYVGGHGGLGGSSFLWAIPAPAGGWGWPFVYAALGGLAGLVLANILLFTKLIPQSFGDFPDWEREAEAKLAEAKRAAEAAGESIGEPEAESLGPVLVRTLLLTGPAIAGMFAGTVALTNAGKPMLGMAVGGVGWAGHRHGPSRGDWSEVARRRRPERGRPAVGPVPARPPGDAQGSLFVGTGDRADAGRGVVRAQARRAR